jgi:acetoin utilization deacetylase AcuC-like enzyme
LYFSDPACLAHDPRAWMPGHPDAPERLSAIELELARHDWLGWERRPAPRASENELALIHDRGYIEALRDFCARGGGALDADTFADQASYRAALHAAGGATAMTRALAGGEATLGFCAVRPPGHHAERGRAMGFCLFNSVACAAELATAELGLERVLIVDLDVHHGNGTAGAFRQRRDVLYASIHQRGLFPGTGALEDVGSGDGEGFTINLPVPAGAGEEEWRSLLEHVLMPAARAFEPRLVLISAGFDAHRADPLASCQLEAGSFAEMARQLRAEAERLRAPIGAVLEGGYEPTALAESVRQTMAALAGDGRAPASAPEPQLTGQALARIGRYWPV